LLSQLPPEKKIFTLRDLRFLPQSNKGRKDFLNTV